MLDVPARDLLAFHEAGHAVMAVILGRRVRCASIRRRRDLNGYVDYENATSRILGITSEHRPLIETDVLVLLAGRAAECQLTLGTPRSHAGLDRQNARALLGILEPYEEVVSSWMRYLLVRAQAMLQDEWSLVYAVARALMRDEELTGDAIACIVEEARSRMATREPSNVRFVVSEDALASIRELPRPECAIDPNSTDVLQVPVPNAALSIDSGSDRNLFHRTFTEVMQLSPRARNCLQRGGMVTLADLCHRTVRDLQSIRALGAKTLDEILAELRRLGITLPSSRPKRFLS